MVRRHAVVLTLALAAPLLVACSDTSEIVSDPGDLDAAVAVWTDPWVAPTAASVAGPSIGSDGFVDRVVAGRETTYAIGVEAAARVELRLAESAGWVVTSSTCYDSIQMALASADGEAIARLLLTPERRGATTASLQVITRHHLDGSMWKVPEAAEGTCLDGDVAMFVQPPSSGAPLGQVSDDRTAEWSHDTPDEDYIDAVNADPAMTDLRITIAVPRIEEGVNRRQAPAARVDSDVGSLQELAERLGDWELTYAACGGYGPVRATFVRDVGGGHAVLAAEVRPDGTTLRVTVPMTEGPTGEWLDDAQAIDPSTCTPNPPSRRPRAYGTPAVLPSVLTPIAP